LDLRPPRIAQKVSRVPNPAIVGKMSKESYLAGESPKSGETHQKYPGESHGGFRRETAIT
jgi:hypothetical protein